MKEELQGKLIEILSSIQAATVRANDFAMEQLPEIAQSYVLFGRVMYTGWLAVGFLLLVVGVVLFYLGVRSDAKGEQEYKAAKVAWDERAPYPQEILGGGIALKRGEPSRFGYPDGSALKTASLPFAGLGAFFVALSVNSALLVWFAPKVWLLKEIAGLIR